MAIYLKYGSIEGSSQTTGVEKWIECDSFQFGVGRGVASARGGITREASEASVSDITLSKSIDKSSGPILEQALWGKGEKAELKFSRTKAGGGGVDFYLTYELTEAIVSGYSISSGGDRPTESISFNFNAFSTGIDLGGDDNAAGGAFTTGYDLAIAKKK